MSGNLRKRELRPVCNGLCEECGLVAGARWACACGAWLCQNCLARHVEDRGHRWPVGRPKLPRAVVGSAEPGRL